MHRLDGKYFIDASSLTFEPEDGPPRLVALCEHGEILGPVDDSGWYYLVDVWPEDGSLLPRTQRVLSLEAMEAWQLFTDKVVFEAAWQLHQEVRAELCAVARRQGDGDPRPVRKEPV